MAEPPGYKVNRFRGKWYKMDKARKIEKYLVENEWTGTGWYWINTNGERISFSY